MKKLIYICSVLCMLTAHAQTIQEIDSLTVEFCDFVEKSQLKSDQKKIEVLHNEMIMPYLKKLKGADTELVFNQIFFRMQRNCLEFELLLERLDQNPKSEKPERVREKPECKLTDAELEEFKKREKFYYPENDGTKTKVFVKQGFWTDRFKNKTFSKLHMRWIGKAEFELEFIESDNVTRKNLSVPGDKYNYQLISKEDKFYWMSYNVPGQDVYTKFKLYFK